MVKVKIKPNLSGPKPTRVYWSDTFYVLAYESAKQGLNNREIAERLGCSYPSFTNWLGEKPALKDAILKGREQNEMTFSDFVYKHLPPDLKDLYNEIADVGDSRDALTRITSLLHDKGDAVKQHLFLYALVESDFDPSQALSKLALNKAHLDKWVRTDPNFGRLCEEVIFHKKNFLEGALFKLIKQGDKSAIIFGNKTLNSDRGFGNTLKVQHDGQVNVTGQISMEDLPLSLEDKKKILQAIKQKRNQLPEHVDDAEYEVRKS